VTPTNTPTPTATSSNLLPPNDNSQAFVSVDYGNNIFVGSQGGNTVQRSTDGGVTWSQHITLPSVSPYTWFGVSAIQFVGGRFFVSPSWGVNDSNSNPFIFTSTDGISWTTINLNRLVGSWVNSIDGGGFAYGNGIYIYMPTAVSYNQSYANQVFVYTSTNGISWTINILSEIPRGGLCFNAATNEFLLTNGITLYKSTNGVSWTVKANISQQLDSACYKLLTSSTPGTLYAFGRIGKILKSIDSGVSWSQSGSILSNWLGYDSKMLNNKILFCSTGTFDNTANFLWLSDDGGNTWINTRIGGAVALAVNSASNRVVVSSWGQHSPGGGVQPGRGLYYLDTL
jgi:hypothetical protein